MADRTTIGPHLVHRLVLAAFDVAIIAVAMLDRHAGIGAMFGIFIGAIGLAVRDRRRAQKRAAESAEIDRKLAVALAVASAVTAKRQDDPDLSEERWS